MSSRWGSLARPGYNRAIYSNPHTTLVKHVERLRHKVCFAPHDIPEVSKITFEPQLDGSVLGAQMTVLGMTCGLAAYWWFVVVPSERASLARQKRKGAVATYLEGVQNNPEKKLERWFYTDWLQSSWFKARSRGLKQLEARQQDEIQHVGADGENAADQSIDPLDATASNNLLKPSFDTPTPRFLSLDNPIIATAVLLASVAVVSALSRSP